MVQVTGSTSSVASQVQDGDRRNRSGGRRHGNPRRLVEDGAGEPVDSVSAAAAEWMPEAEWWSRECPFRSWSGLLSGTMQNAMD